MRYAIQNSIPHFINQTNMIKRKIIFFFIISLSISLYGNQPFNIKHGPYLQSITENEVTIVWVTSKDALAWVEIAPDDGSHFYAKERSKFFQTENGRKLVGTLHNVTITGLQKGTKYRYRIYSREIIDNYNWDTSFGKIEASSAYRTYSFSTLDSDKSNFSFSVVNDIHADTLALRELLDQVDLTKKDFVIFNGDMMSHLNSETLMFDGFLDKSIEIFASNTPFFFTRGNHETRGPFSTRFMEYFPSSTGKPYFTFRHGPAYFIMLDSGEDKPDSDIEYGGLSDFDAYREQQVKWLAEVLDSDEFKQAPIKIVAIHIPAFTSTWHGTLHVQELFIPILNKANIDLMFCGHTHRYRYIKKNEFDNNFPIIVNSNREIMDFDINNNNINVTIKDQKGTIKQEFVF